MIIRFIRYFFITSLFFIAVILTALRCFIFQIDHYKNDIERTLSHFLDTTVTIQQISAKMYWLYPEITLKNITLSNKINQNKNLSLNKLRLGFDLWKAIYQAKVMQSLRVTLVGAKLSVIRQTDGRFSLVGLKTEGEGQPLWLLQGKHYQLINSEIHWLNKKRHGQALIFKNVNVVIKNDPSSHRHQAVFLSYLPSEYGKKLRIVIDIKGNIFHPNTLNGKVFIKGEKIQFARLLTGELPLDLNLKQGAGDFKIWGTIKNSELSGLKGSVNAKNLNLRRKNHKKVNFKHIKGHFNWASQGHHWILKVRDLYTQRPQEKAKKATFFLRYHQETYLSARIEQIDLALLNQLQHFFISSPLALNTDIAIKGLLLNGRVFADLKNEHYALKADFKQFSIIDRVQNQQLLNVSGSILGTEQHGILTFKSHDSLLKQPYLFRQPIKISRLKGQLKWQQTKASWFINSGKLTLNTAHFNSQHKLFFKWNKKESSHFIDLQTYFGNIKSVQTLKRYFPLGVMDKEVLSWLDTAFVKGSIPHGRLELSGNLEDFPFKKGQGIFDVSFKTLGLELAYADFWPNFTAIEADVSFLNDGLNVMVHQAKSANIVLNKVKVKIPSFGENTPLLVEGKAKGTIMSGLNWLQKTPLDLSIKPVLKQIHFKGNTAVDLALSIPLTEKGHTKIKGQARFKAASAEFKTVDLPVTGVKGTLYFDETQFYADKLTAQVFNLPIDIQLKKTASALTVKVKGQVDVATLQANVQSPWLNLATGKTDYQLIFHRPMNEKKETQVSISSDLKGIALKLPKGVGKKITEKKSLKISFPINDYLLLPVKASYNQAFKARLKINKRLKKLHSAHLVWGSSYANFLTQKGIVIEVNQPRFVALDWLGVMKSVGHKSDEANLALPLNFTLKTPKLLWNTQNLGALDLRLSRRNQSWEGHLQCMMAEGKFEFNKTDYNLTMNFIDVSKLSDISTSKPKTASATSEPLFEQLPLIQVYSKKLIWREVNLGRLNISSQREGSEVFFNNISLTGNDYTLLSVGHWRKRGLASQSDLQGRFSAKTFGRLLEKLDVSHDLKETSAQMNLDINWQKPPYDFSFAELNGKVNVSLGQGRISSIEPGIGRMLGVLAIEQWVKRLQLDFRDIYEEGLSFNHITGDYYLHKGLAHTDGLVIDAIPAKITLKGNIDLGKKWLDTEISIIPKSAESLPIAGVIMGTIATTIAQEITGEYEDGFYLRKKYQLQGQWNNLKMTSMHDKDGFLHQVWRELTDFSWVVD